MDKEQFVQALKNRTKKFAVALLRFYGQMRKTAETRIVGKQLPRSATSTAANYRAACRARFKAEFFSKMSIVVEEADETLFWLEVLEESDILPSSQLYHLKKEALEILSIVAKARKNTR